MRLLIFTGAFIFAFAALSAQTGEEDLLRLKQELGESVHQVPDEEVLTGEKEKPGHWNFSVGTSYSYMKGYGSGMMFYTAPTYTLALNDRWALHGGIMASFYQGMNHTLMGEEYLPRTLSSLAMFAAASYRMSDNLTIHGTGIKQLVSGPVTPFTPYPMDDFSLGATYRIGDNLTIGASVHMRNFSGYRTGYYGGTPFGTPLGTPYYPSPFGW